MRRSTLIALICAGFISFTLRNSLRAVDDKPAIPPPAKQPENSPRKTQSSDKAVVKDIVYGLEEEENRLFLTSQPLNGEDRELTRVELRFEIPQGGQVVELSLAKLGSNNLMAVVKIHQGDEYDFHCLTFIGPWGGGHVREKFAFYKAKLFTARDNLKILAVGGKHFAGSVFIVLGDWTLDDDPDMSMVTEGVFYFSGCPWPPSDGQLSPFRVKSAPPKKNAD